MATTSLDEKLELIRQARNDIQTAIQNKGQAVNTDIRTYAEAINNISALSTEEYNTAIEIARDIKGNQ